MTYHLVSTQLNAFIQSRQKYSLKKRPDNPPKDLKLPEATIIEIMETITTNENNTNSKEPIHEPNDKEDLMNLFKQYPDFTPPTSD